MEECATNDALRFVYKPRDLAAGQSIGDEPQNAPFHRGQLRERGLLLRQIRRACAAPNSG